VEETQETLLTVTNSTVIFKKEGRKERKEGGRERKKRKT